MRSVEVSTLIRRPAAEVFAAFVNPAVTTRFWFTKSSGRLEAGKEVTWTWEMYDASAPVTVKALEPNRRIEIEWPGANGPNTVEWSFTEMADDSTFVEITNSGFSGEPDAVVAEALDSTEGFTLVLAGLKALLEHGIELNLVGDRYPAGLDGH
jgi:uncharacterized protein YndB with AHSA1/START domain